MEKLQNSPKLRKELLKTLTARFEKLEASVSERLDKRGEDNPEIPPELFEMAGMITFIAKMKPHLAEPCARVFAAAYGILASEDEVLALAILRSQF